MIVATRTAGAADGIDEAANQPSPSSSSSPSFGQRVEVPDTGYAVAFPEDWVVEIVEEDSDTAILVVSEPERFAPEVELRNLLVAWGPEGHERDTLNICTLVRYQPIELTANEFLNEIFGQSDVAVESLHEGLSRVFMNQFMKGRVLTDEPKAVYSDRLRHRWRRRGRLTLVYGRAVPP